MPSDTQLVLVGSYADADQPSIRLYEFSPASGALSERGSVAGIANPSFLALHPNGTALFAVSETAAPNGPPGGVRALRFDRATGSFELLNEQPSGGNWPCHLCIDPSGRWLIASNYGSGSVGVFPIAEDGSLGAHTDLVQHRGSGPNPQRQEGPHAHSATPTPDGQLILVADLGVDQLGVYQLDTDKGTLARQGTVAAPRGVGPRHIAWSADGTSLFLATELGNQVIRYSYDAAAGSFSEEQIISTLPEGAPENYVADIHTSPDGTRLYVSNRGHNSIAAYTIGAGNALALAGHASCGGNWPRNFAVAPDGRWLLVANQNSGDIAILPVGDDGVPGEAAAHVAVPGASFVLFV